MSTKPQSYVESVLRDAHLPEQVVQVYTAALVAGGFDTPPGLQCVTLDDLADAGFRKGHARLLVRHLSSEVVREASASVKGSTHSLSCCAVAAWRCCVGVGGGGGGAAHVKLRLPPALPQKKEAPDASASGDDIIVVGPAVAGQTLADAVKGKFVYTHGEQLQRRVCTGITMLCDDTCGTRGCSGCALFQVMKRERVSAKKMVVGCKALGSPWLYVLPVCVFVCVQVRPCLCAGMCDTNAPPPAPLCASS